MRFQCIPDASAQNLLPFVTNFIAPGSKIITDGWPGYNEVEKSGYTHDVRVIKGSGHQAHDLLPHVHLVDSLVKRWINGTHQGNIDPFHLPFYLDEFAFRFNRRLSSHRGKLFFRLIQQALTTPPHPYKGIIKTKSKKAPEGNRLRKLIEDLNTDNKQIWALKKVKDIDPIVEQCVRNFAELSPLKYIKITDNSIIASNQIEGGRDKTPITKPFHPTAIGVHLIYDCQFKTLEFFEINSAIKGWGEAMVKAALNKYLKTGSQR